MLQYDLEQLFYSTLQENGIQAHQFLYDRENGCNRVTANWFTGGNGCMD